MPTTDEPAFYPSTELERHGLTPDTWGQPACYALELDVPGVDAFREAWHSVYEIPAPHALAVAVGDRQNLVYVGCANDLRARINDHLTRARNTVNLLEVCPPTGIVDVWPYDSFTDAEDHERGHAFEVSQADANRVCWVNGEIV